MKPFISFTAFDGTRRIATGPLHEVAATASDSVLIYDDATGRVVDIDTRHFAPPQAPEDTAEEVRGRGRPRLGVVAREVTLLPRHWDWLSTQPGGASVALRKLVEEARKTSGSRDRQRASHEAAYHFMSAMAGDLPGFEEASRSLFANDRRRFSELIANWPEDVRDHAIKLAFSDLEPENS